MLVGIGVAEMPLRVKLVDLDGVKKVEKGMIRPILRRAHRYAILVSELRSPSRRDVETDDSEISFCFFETGIVVVVDDVVDVWRKDRRE